MPPLVPVRAPLDARPRPVAPTGAGGGPDARAEVAARALAPCLRPADRAAFARAVRGSNQAASAARAWIARAPAETLLAGHPRAASVRARPGMLRAFVTGLKLGAPLFVAYGLLFHFSVVRGSSMSPGIHDGDRILIDQLRYVLSDVRRGDVVVLQYPLDPTLDYIKRVIGLPGDRVRIAGGRVWLNEAPLDEPYVAEPDLGDELELVVAEGHYFVLGDNRPHSSDSREFGLVPREFLRGCADVRLWPPQRAGLID